MDAKPGGTIPSAWGQELPRGVVLASGSMLVPAKTVAALLRNGGSPTLRYVGHCMSPALRSCEEFTVRPAIAEQGDLALIDCGGWADVQRIVARTSGEDLVGAVDAFPRGRQIIPRSSVLGVLSDSGGLGGRLIAVGFPIWSRYAAIRYWLRKIAEAPDYHEGSGSSIEGKYQWQVESYQTILDAPMSDEIMALLARTFPGRGEILVPGCGVGREALHLAHAGYRVAGFDLIPAMIDAARRNARTKDLAGEFFVADMTSLDLGDRRFDGVYVTPLVYSFIQGRSRRIESLRRLGRHLRPGGRVIFSAHMIRSVESWLRVSLAWSLRRSRSRRGPEYGDWFTWFLTPQGTIGKAFSHRFSVRRLIAEVRAAGFGSIRLERGVMHFVAGEFGE